MNIFRFTGPDKALEGPGSERGGGEFKATLRAKKTLIDQVNGKNFTTQLDDEGCIFFAAGLYIGLKISTRTIGEDPTGKIIFFLGWEMRLGIQASRHPK